MGEQDPTDAADETAPVRVVREQTPPQQPAEDVVEQDPTDAADETAPVRVVREQTPPQQAPTETDDSESNPSGTAPKRTAAETVAAAQGQSRFSRTGSNLRRRRGGYGDKVLKRWFEYLLGSRDSPLTPHEFEY